MGFLTLLKDLFPQNYWPRLIKSLVKVSVIIPTFNRAYCLERAIDSVLNQSYRDFEIIVIDDGSTDETESLLQKLLERSAQLRYYKIENSGVSRARNLGVSKSSGEWIGFLDSDDCWHSHKLQRQIDFIHSNPKVQLVHAHEKWVRNGKEVKIPKRYQKSGGDIFIRSLDQCMISPSVALLSRNLFQRYNGFREDYLVCEDYDLWLKITSEYEVGFIDEPLCTKYGGHEDQLSMKYFAMDYFRVKSMQWILENRELEISKKLALLDMLIKKGSVLITGYLKHGNLKDLHEVKSIVESASQIKCSLLKEKL